MTFRRSSFRFLAFNPYHFPVPVINSLNSFLGQPESLRVADNQPNVVVRHINEISCLGKEKDDAKDLLLRRNRSPKYDTCQRFMPYRRRCRLEIAFGTSSTKIILKVKPIRDLPVSLNDLYRIFNERLGSRDDHMMFRVHYSLVTPIDSSLD